MTSSSVGMTITFTGEYFIPKTLLNQSYPMLFIQFYHFGNGLTILTIT